MHIETSAYAMHDHLKSISKGWAPIYEALEKPDEFMCHSASVVVNDITIGSMANSAMRISIKNPGTPMLFIPLAGSGSYSSRDETIAIRANDVAALLPRDSYVGESTLRSSLILFFNPDRLEATIRSMLGLEEAASNLIDIDRPQEVALRYGGLSFDGVFRQIAGTIDLFSSQPGLLSLSGINDQIYRTMAMMLKPNLFNIQADIVPTQSYSRKLLDRSCQYIQENKHQLITLTDLERVSCMSRRNLHYAFQSHFNCTPMQWVRVQRLESARSMLVKAGSTLSVTDTAFLCGFNKSSTFSYYYNLRFGELPSETIANAR
jgi:AraC-like DNA-binding protein